MEFLTIARIGLQRTGTQQVYCTMLGFLTFTQREYVLLTLELGHVLARPLYEFQCSSILCLRGISRGSSFLVKKYRHIHVTQVCPMPKTQYNVVVSKRSILPSMRSLTIATKIRPSSHPNNLELTLPYVRKPTTTKARAGEKTLRKSARFCRPLVGSSIARMPIPPKQFLWEMIQPKYTQSNHEDQLNLSPEHWDGRFFYALI